MAYEQTTNAIKTTSMGRGACGPKRAGQLMVLAWTLMGPLAQAIDLEDVLYGIQMVESNLLTPIVERRTISIRPAFLLLVQIIFGLFFGILGLTFASPMIAAGIVLTRELYIKPMEQGEKRLLKKQE